MRKKNQTMNLKITIFLVMLSSGLYAQINTLEIKKEISQVTEKPEPYDSLVNWEYFSKVGNYKKYIGQKVYLANHEINVNPEDRNPRISPFLFTKEKKSYRISDINSLEGLSNTFIFNQSNISPEYHSKLVLDSISTNIYKPFFYFGYYNSYGYDAKKDFRFTNSEIKKRYYIITDIISGNDLDEIEFGLDYYYQAMPIKSKRRNQIKTDKLESEINTNRKFAYKLKDVENDDIVYYIEKGQNRFVLVSYYLKKEQIYKGKYLLSQNDFSKRDIKKVEIIEDNNGYQKEKSKEVQIKVGSRWLCENVSILDNDNSIYFILTNDKDETIAVTDVDKYPWILEEVYLENKLEKVAIAQKEKDEQLQRISERKAKEEREYQSRLAKYIEKYGTEYGQLIADEKVSIGMTKEMCELAWGKPLYKEKTEIKNSIIENWHYGFIRSLAFLDNRLKQIAQ